MEKILTNVGQQFANGVALEVFVAETWPPIEGLRPAGAAVTSGTVAGGEVAFGGLAPGREYLAGTTVGGRWRFVAFDTHGEVGEPLDDRVFAVQDFGAVGDGVTDDTAAIQAAVDACSDAGGGRVDLMAEHFVNAAANTGGGISWGVHIHEDDVVLAAATGRTVIHSTAAGAQFFFCGSGKGGNMDEWDTTRLTDLTPLAFTAAAAFAGQVVMSTHADAGGFAAGDAVYLRTGATTGRITEPDAELNHVVAASASTGVVQLKRPLRKPYAQEHYQAGHVNEAGFDTSTSSSAPYTGGNAPFGIAKANDRTISNVGFQGRFLFDSAGEAPQVVLVIGVFQFRADRMEFNARIAVLSLPETDGARVGEVVAHFTASGLIDLHEILTLATGCTDYYCPSHIGTSDLNVIDLHMHEGVADARVMGMILAIPPGNTSGWWAASIGARSYRNDVELYVINGSNAPAILTDASCPDGGRLIRPRLRGTFPGGSGIVLQSPGWQIIDPDIPGDLAVSFNGNDANHRASLVPYEPQELKLLLRYNDAGQKLLGTIPAASQLLEVTVEVAAVFDAATSNTIDVGVESPFDKAYVQSLDVGEATYHRSRVSATFSASARNVFARFNQSGAAATHGLAIVTVRYVRTLDL